MRLGVFLIHGSALPSGHITYQQSMVAGLLAQDRHEIVILASERDPVPDVPAPHELIRLRHPYQRFVAAANFDLHAEGVATIAARKAGLDALVANAQWAMPHPPGVPRIAIFYEMAFLDPVPWGVYSAYTFRHLVTMPVRNLRQKPEVVVCLSEHGKQQISNRLRLPLDRIVVAPPAVRPFPACESTPFRPAGNYVLMVGWFHPRKDVVLALRSWRHAVESGLDADFVLAGNEGPRDRVNGSIGRRIIDTVGVDLAGRVHYTGSLPRADLGALYRDASAVIMTSIHEGFGIPAIEAFSMGVPVVAARRASLPEAVGSFGVVADPEPAALGAALFDVCRTRVDPAPLRAYAADFTSERQVKPILDAADRLASRRSVGAPR
ncbi:MAG: hypothetical protein QOG90_1508 [Actinomycetota bacterium]|jgi:glycosyltransferase involved in cell wall biosynthesis